MKNIKEKTKYIAGGFFTTYVLGKALGKYTLIAPILSYGYAYSKKNKKLESFSIGSLLATITTSATSAKASSINYDEVVIGGEFYPIETKGLFNVVDFIEDPYFDLANKTTHYNKKVDRPVTYFVLHHGGYDLDYLADVFIDRRASTHFGIGLNPDGTVTVAQYLDLDNLAWHTPSHNSESIGIDFAISPLAENADRYGLPIVPFPPGDRNYGLTEITELPDSMIKAAVQLLKELHRIYNLRMDINPHKDALYSKDDVFRGEAQDFTVFGHHNLDSSRFDTVYLWDRLLEEANG